MSKKGTYLYNRFKFKEQIFFIQHLFVDSLETADFKINEKQFKVLQSMEGSEILRQS